MSIFTKVFGVLAALCSFLAIPQTALAQRMAVAPPSASEIPIAMLVDMQSGQILHQRAIDRRFMPASITKVMTAYLAFELLEDDKLRLDQRFPFRQESFQRWGGTGSTMFLSSGDNLPVRDLLLGITTVSANDASVVLGEGASGSLAEWTRLMNEKAREIGMSQSHFGTPNGWPDEGRTFVTARDLVTLGSAMIVQHPDLYREFFGHTQLSFRGITQPNHDPLSGKFRGGDGIKTGFTNEAGYGFLGSAVRNGRRLLMVVAAAERSRIRDRAAREYMEWGFQAFDSRPLFASGERIGTARVQGGEQRKVSLMTDRMIAAALPHGSNPSIELSINYDGPLYAPIARGEKVAELEIRVDGMEPSRLPLFADKDVAEAGPFARLLNGILGWFG